MHPKLPSLLAIGCTVADPVGGDPATPPSTAFDLSYGDHALHRLDVYLPDDGEPSEVVVFVHGGSWTGGDKANLRESAGFVDWFAERGYAVVAPNVRLASPPSGPREVVIADMMADLAAAVRWTVDDGGEHGVPDADPVLIGFSSGAHLVALLGADPTYLTAEGLSPDALRATVSLDVHAYDVPLALSLMDGSEIEANIPLIRGLFGETEAEQRALSPSSFVAEPSIPRSLLVSADPSDDPTSKGWIARETSAAHAERLRDAGHAAEHVHFDAATHSGLVVGFGQEGHPPTARVAAFLGDGE